MTEQQIRKRIREQIDGRDRDLWPATKQIREWLIKNYGDDDRVDWRVKQTGDVDTIDFYACDGHVDYLNVREFADPNDVPSTRIRERIEDAYCGNCPECLAEADRDAHDAAGRKAARRHASASASDTDVAAVARYDLERACVRHGCMLWCDVSNVDGPTDLMAIVTRNGRALMTPWPNMHTMVRNGESIDDLVRAWAEGVE